ncbi:DUF4190 domain-containing protein [Nocardioides ochotonae]|uniref:DUF4190 domain-containing protein n=1 Tax=Nocardioides ochotonae TaxID=2685869 RepID=UPI0014073B51|nr:DUF4190 domain-containing protein [Nocardioides ochotonae]
MTQPPQYPGPSDPDEPTPSGPPPGSPPPHPYGQAPYGTNPSAPTPPSYPQVPYGEAPAGPPPYNQNPYGQAPHGQAPYGTPFPGGPRQESAPQGMAISSLVLAFFGCLILPAIISIVLAVIVLRRGRDGRNHGKGLALGAIAVSAVSVLATLAFGALIAFTIAVSEDVNDLTTGDCFNAPGLADDDEEFTSIDTVPCDDPHDAEVLGTVELSADQAAQYSGSALAGNAWCGEATGFWTPADDSGLALMRLTDDTEPDAGDTLACVVYDEDGDKLSGPLR